MSATPPIACNLAAIPEAERQRYFALRAEVLAAADPIEETADGYGLHLATARVSLPALAEWIAFERLCCPFLRFRLTLEGDAPVRLELGGEPGVKELLRHELGMTLVSPSSLVRAPR